MPLLKDIIGCYDNGHMATGVLLDTNRLAVLRDLNILDTPTEIPYNDIAALASACCQTSIAAVNFVDGTRHWTKAIVGDDGSQGASVSADLSFCAEQFALLVEF